jgi:hypothetical protein
LTSTFLPAYMALASMLCSRAYAAMPLPDASAQCQAGEISNYVERVVSAVAEGDANLPSVQLDTWVVWALAQADRIDPVQSGRFIEAMKDPAD